MTNTNITTSHSVASAVTNESLDLLVASLAPRMETLRRIEKLRTLQQALFDNADIDLTQDETVEPWWVLVESETATDVALILDWFAIKWELNSEQLLALLQPRLGLTDADLLWFGHIITRPSFSAPDLTERLDQEIEELDRHLGEVLKAREEARRRKKKMKPYTLVRRGNTWVMEAGASSE